MNLTVAIEVDGATYNLPTLSHREQMTLAEAFEAEERKQFFADLEDAKIEGEHRKDALMEWRRGRSVLVNILTMALRDPDRVISVAIHKAGLSMESIEHMSSTERSGLAHDLLALNLDAGESKGKATSATSSAPAP